MGERGRETRIQSPRAVRLFSKAGCWVLASLCAPCVPLSSAANRSGGVLRSIRFARLAFERITPLHTGVLIVGVPVWNLLTVRVIAAEVFPHLAPALPLPGARPPRCQWNHPQDTQNPAHRYTLLLRMSGVNYPTMRTGGRRTGGWRSPN